MNKHLLYINEKLADCGAKYWIDSGVLLGLYREGNLLSQDRDSDIDISMIYNKNAVERLIGSIDSKKYRIKKVSYRKRLMDCKIIPRNYGENVRFIELKMYRNSNGHLFNLQGILNSDAYAWNQLFTIHNYIFKTTHRFLAPHIQMDSLFWEKIFKIGAFTIPKKFVENLTKLKVNGFEFPTPNPIEEYLKYRYGANWQNPEAEWDGLWKDDGAAELIEHPERFF